MSEKAKASKFTERPVSKKPKQLKKPKKNVTFNRNATVQRSASIKGPYDRTPLKGSKITKEEEDEQSELGNLIAYREFSNPYLGAFRSEAIEKANSHLGPSDPTMRSDTDEINKQKMERNKQLYRDRDYNDFLAQQEKLREEQGPTDSLLRQTAMTGPSSNFDDTYTSGPTDYSQYTGLSVGRSNTESGNFGGKRRTKKSRKSRKARKTRKVRKVRKAKGG